jgi:transposase-like protein
LTACLRLEGEVLDVLVQSKRNKRAALKLMRKLLKKYCFVPDNLITDDLRSYAAAPENLESQNAMSAADGATIERRIRISRPGDENTRCKVSRAPDRHKDFSQCIQQSTTLRQEHIEPSGHRRCKRGVKL